MLFTKEEDVQDLIPYSNSWVFFQFRAQNHVGNRSTTFPQNFAPRNETAPSESLWEGTCKTLTVK